MSNNKIVIILTVLISLIFLTTFFSSFNLIDGFETAKTLYFYLVINILIIISFAILLFNRRKVKAGLNFIDLSIILYYLYICLGLVFVSFNNLNNSHLMIMTFLIIFYFFIKYLNKNKEACKQIRLIIIVFITAGIIQCIICLLQLYGFIPSFSDYFMMTGTLGNPELLSGYLSSIIPFAFSYYILSGKTRITEKRLATIFLLLSLLIIPSTMIRNGWIAISIAIIYVLYQQYKIKTINLFADKIKTILVTFSILAATVGIIYGLYLLKPDSANGRIFIWKITFNMIKDNPIFGIGFDRFRVEYGNYQEEYFAENSNNDSENILAGNVNHADNDYLQIWSELGIIGLILFFTIIFFVLKTKNRNNNINLLSAKASFISILIFMFGADPMHTLPTEINFFFLLGIISSYDEEYLSFEIPKFIIRPICIVLIISGVILIINTIEKFYNYKKWQYAVNISIMGQYALANKNFKELYPDLKNDGQFLLNYGGMLSLKGEHKEAIELLNKSKNKYTDPNIYISLGNSYCALGDTLIAEKNYLYAYYLIPNRIYPLYLLTKMYFKFNMYSKGEEMGVKVLQFKEKVPSRAVDEMKSEIKKLLDSRSLK